MSKAMCISTGTVTYVSIKIFRKEERKPKTDFECRTEHKTRSSVRITGRKTGREEIIHNNTTQTQTDKECALGRPRLLLIKRQGWEFTLVSTNSP